MGHIFISYSRKDEEYVNKLVDALENEGFEVWIDRELLMGDTWIQTINQKIDACDAFVIVMTDDSKKSKWVSREVLYALQEEKRIVPLLLQGKLWMLLQDFNYFKVTDGLIPDRKFFKDIEKTVPRSEAWLKSQREAAEKAAREKSRLEAEKLERQKAEKEKKDREEPERKRKEKELREKQAREGREKEKHESEKKEEKPVTAKPKTGGQIAYWLGGFIVLVLGIILLSSLNNPSSVEQPTPEKTQTQAVVTLVQETVEPSVTSTSVNTLTPIPLPTEVTDAKDITMRLVPAGEFSMGSETNYDEKPIHQIYLDAFYMDIYEVTNDAYKICVDAGKCIPPAPRPRIVYVGSFSINQGDWYSWGSNPIASVSWDQAQTFCEWRSARLPTEAEWEKAARGVDGRTYPWGEEVSCDDANYSGCNYYDYTLYVEGNRGPSPYGVYDMAGNVWEWVGDWYSENYYEDSPNINPLGPVSGKYRVIRGGAWNNFESSIRTSIRKWENPNNRRQDLGFRCAKDINP